MSLSDRVTSWALARRSRRERIRWRRPRGHERSVPQSAERCPSCHNHTDAHELARALWVCPSCGYHYRINAPDRIRMLLDAGEISEFEHTTDVADPIEFPGYREKVIAAREKSGLEEAVSAGVGRIEGNEVAVAVMSFAFLGGSMGSLVGERITEAMLAALRLRIPCIVFTASGGARMHEGIFSLMQMARTSHAAALLADAAVPLFVVLTDPTTGGVSASFAMLGDVTLAEPGALIGFAGPRVIEGTIRQKLPPGFQRSEFQLEHGFVDAVVPRGELRSTLAWLVEVHGRGRDGGR